MITDAKVAVIGGGVAGCSLLYQLTRLGWSDVVLLEQHELTSGSTWHSAGLCTQFNQSYNVMGLLRASVELYEQLEADTGHAVDYHRCGSVRIATSEDRVHQFLHVGGIAESVGVPFEIVTPERALELFPLMDPEGVVAAAYLPTDGHVDPSGLTHALAKGASARGARIVRHSRVTAIERRDGAWQLSVEGSETSTIRAEIVVNAAGMWAREVAALVGARLPLVPMQHHYLVTEPIDAVAERDRELPVFRDPDNSFYCRQEHGGLLLGPFERDPQTWALDGIPEGFHSRLLPSDLERIARHLEDAGRRIPVFAEAGIRTVVNGPDAYTPDGRCLMGAVPGLRNFHVLAGFSIFGVVFAGGAGKYAAEWIVDGQPSDNMWELDVRRFGDFASDTGYVVARASEVFEDEYKIHFPEEERPAGRPLKLDPLYERLLAKGAVFGVRFGWERPLWFSRNGPAQDEYSFRRGNWFERGRRGVPGRAFSRGRPRPDELREVRGLGAGGGSLPRPAVRELAADGGANRAHADADAERWHRVRSDRQPSRRRSVLPRLCRGHRAPRLRVDRAPPPRRRLRDPRERDGEVRRPDPGRAALARAVAARHGGRRLARGAAVLRPARDQRG